MRDNAEKSREVENRYREEDREQRTRETDRHTDRQDIGRLSGQPNPGKSYILCYDYLPTYLVCVTLTT